MRAMITIAHECRTCKDSFEIDIPAFCCRRCYQAYQKANATGHVDTHGYRRLTINGKHFLEHRLVMERVLGRKLLRTEEVHHINRDRVDNRPENLQIVGRVEHMGHHRTWDIELAKEMRLQGRTFQEIGERFGVTGQSIYAGLKRAGFKIPT